MSQAVADIIQQIDDADLWDDRRYYSGDMLKDFYALDDHDAALLYNNIQAYCNVDYRWTAQPEGQLIETLHEAAHQGYDGWTPAEKVIIEAFLADIAWATSQTIKDRKND